jgi:ketosteroid isomerase-like protein
MPHDAKALADLLLEAWNARDIQQFVGLLAKDIEWYDPAMSQPPARGRSDVQSFAESVLRAFPDFYYEILGPVCVSPDGGRCAVPWRITATHKALLSPPGFAPTHRQLTQEGIDLIEAQDGEVTRILTYFDPIAAGEQLLDLRLRPIPGSFWERTLVALQRLAATRARRRARFSASASGD